MRPPFTFNGRDCPSFRDRLQRKSDPGGRFGMGFPRDAAALAAFRGSDCRIGRFPDAPLPRCCSSGSSSVASNGYVALGNGRRRPILARIAWRRSRLIATSAIGQCGQVFIRRQPSGRSGQSAQAAECAAAARPDEAPDRIGGLSIPCPRCGGETGRPG